MKRPIMPPPPAEMAQLLSNLCRKAFQGSLRAFAGGLCLAGILLPPVSAQEAPAPVATAPWQLDLGPIGWLPGAPADGEGDFAWWQLPGGAILPIDTLWIRGLGREGIHGIKNPETDFLWVRARDGSPDLRKGWLTAWEAEGLRFESLGGEHLHAWEAIEALQLLAEPLPMLESEHARYLVFQGGGFLRVQSFFEKEGKWIAKLPWNDEVEFRKEALAEVYPAQFPMPPLLKTTGPNDAIDRTPRRGRSIEGKPLRCGSKVWPDGWGTLVPSRIDYQWAGAGEFHAWVGVDEEVLEFRNPQPVIFQVFLNDALLWESAALTVQDNPLPVQVTVPKAGVLSLRTKPANRLPWGGHANWLMPTQSPAGSPSNMGASTW